MKIMNNFLQIREMAKRLNPQMIEWRRELHAHPEIGMDLPETANFIRKRLERSGVIILPCDVEHAVIGFIPGSNPDNKAPMALRADMDALNIPEQNSISYKSQHRDRMHACGHDGHMTMLLGAAELLDQCRPERDIFFVFQPGEEGPGGAEQIMKTGILRNVKEIYAIHLDPTMATGMIGINNGRAMASNDDFYITLRGKGGHAGLPHQAVDPIAIAAQIINSFQFIVSRLIDPVDPAVITLGSIKGGYMPNAIAEEVQLSGTIRTYSDSVRKQIQKELEITTRMFCKRYGCEFSINIISGYPPVINSRILSEPLLSYLQNQCGEDFSVNELSSPRMTAEDFSFYLSEIPGVFYWLGCSSGKETSFPLHHSCFNLDEQVLWMGAYIHCLISYK